MPQLISIAVENPEHYIAADSQGHVWRGQVATKPGGPLAIKWERVKSEFPGSSEPVKSWGSP